jgi:hypothetical protein
VDSRGPKSDFCQCVKPFVFAGITSVNLFGVFISAPAFLFLLPVQKHINRVNESLRARPPFHQWSVGDAACLGRVHPELRRRCPALEKNWTKSVALPPTVSADSQPYHRHPWFLCASELRDHKEIGHRGDNKHPDHPVPFHPLYYYCNFFIRKIGDPFSRPSNPDDRNLRSQ